MIHLGLSADDRDVFEAALAQSHMVRCQVAILDSEEATIASLTAPDSNIESGQVNFDAKAPVSRQLSLDVLDRDHALDLVGEIAVDVPLSPSTMVSAVRDHYIEALGRWVPVPMFRGPITRFHRAGSVVNIEAQGKEALLRKPNAFGQNITISKGEPVSTAIRRILERAGEESRDIPDSTRRVRRRFSLSRRQPVWPALQKLADMVDRQIFYDGAGVLRMRPWPESKNSAYIVSTGVDGIVESDSEEIDLVEEIANTVVVSGKWKGKPAVEVAPAWHPLSPGKLGRNGTSRHIVEKIDSNARRRKEGGEKIAKRRMDELLKIQSNVEVTAMCVPHLEEEDFIQVVTDSFTGVVPFRVASVPLFSESMTIGVLRKITRKKGGG